MAENLGDERALNKQSVLLVRRAARVLLLLAGADGAAARGCPCWKNASSRSRRRRAVAFFRDLASQSLQGYTNPEVSHRPRVPKTIKAKPEMEATLDEDRCIIFDVGTGEAKATAYEFVPETTAVKVKDLAKFKDGKVAVKDLCHDRDTSSFVDFVRYADAAPRRYRLDQTGRVPRKSPEAPGFSAGRTNAPRASTRWSRGLVMMQRRVIEARVLQSYM